MDYKKIEKHEEIIICPECKKKQKAEVIHTFPWWSYAHECTSCNTIIMESEWNVYKKK